MKRTIPLILAMLLACVITRAQYPDKNPELQTAGISYLVMDAETGKILDSKNEHTSMTPASTLKILPTAAALEKFGPDYRFETQLAIKGNITADGVLNGDVYILGGSDPALGSLRYQQTYYQPLSFIKQWSNAIRAEGIERIEGNIIGSENQPLNNKIPRTWIWEDIANYFGASASMLNVYENTYQLSFNTGNEAGKQTSITKVTPPGMNLTFSNEVLAANGGGDQAYIFGVPESTKRTVRGTLPKGYNNFIVKGAIPDPALLAARHLKNQLTEDGISVDGEAATGMPEEEEEEEEVQIIDRLVSPPLKDLIKTTNHKSINLYANSLGLLFSVDRIMDEACNKMVEFWNQNGMRTEGLKLEDACGLSPFNQISAYQLAYILKYMQDSEYSDIFRASLPVAGESGTLKYFGHRRDFKGKFTGKSGSIKRVYCYAGYLTTKSGKNCIVVGMLNRYSCSSGEAKAALEDFISTAYNNY
jgi:D-alanyl-D-alanine carboxypeptidase/D-alanyl-D-alanine-endopeptidase (penicillin-binding protein 4)